MGNGIIDCSFLVPGFYKRSLHFVPQTKRALTKLIASKGLIIEYEVSFAEYCLCPDGLSAGLQ